MGLLRFILAAAVIAEHSTPIFGFSFVGGHLAVRLFFIISGFYMALILSTKYTSQPNRYWLFITNRFSRIFPSYYVVLILSLAFYLAATLYLRRPADRLILWQDAMSLGEGVKLLWIALTQITVVGMDTVCLFAYNSANGFHWAASGEIVNKDWLPGMAGAGPAWRLHFVPQSWSISLELLFYLIAPFLVSWKTRNLLLLSFMSGLLYVIFSYLVNPVLLDLLAYFFFPFQLYLFVMGVLAYRYSPVFLSHLRGVAQTTIVAATFGVIIFYQHLRIPYKELVSIVLVFFSVPILFAWTRNSSFHKHLGDLSYPIYIGHVLVKWILLALLGVSQIGMTSPPGWLLLICSTAFACLLLWTIEYPIDKWRQKRVAKATTTFTTHDEDRVAG